MTPPAHPPAPHVGSLTGFVLTLIVVVCVTMIGFAGYLKYELDRSVGVLAAPEAAVATDQESFGRLRRNLGFSGFLGYAQSYLATHDAAHIANMKNEFKGANDIITRLPERTPTEVRRDLQAIVTLFEAALQKAEKSASDNSASFTTADLTALYASLPVLDARITNAASINRLEAQNHLQFWAMLLTLVCWASLIIAAATAVGIYLSLRDRNSAPMRALLQSVKNMAHGDLRSSVWGMERSDMIGELARGMDLARYNFSQVPDMSVMSDQGPVRLRFEGNTKSMFEAMMHLITRDSEQVRTQAATLTEAVNSQQKAITQISTQVESVLHSILERGQDGNQQIKYVLQDMLSSATALKHAQEHAADQLNRIIPFLQERATGLSEITHITGKQVAQALQSLTLTERGLKTSADQSEAAIKKLSSTADDLGGRLFGAVNLLQASGKVLAETTETTQSRLNEAIAKLGGTIQPASGDAPASDASPRLEALIASLEDAHKKLENLLAEQTEAAKAQIDLLTTHSTSLLAQSTTAAQTLSTAADHLRDEQAKLNEALGQAGAKLSDDQSIMMSEAPQNSDQLAALSQQINGLAEKLATLQQPSQTSDTSADHNQLLIEIKTGFETTVRSLSNMREQLTNMVINVQSQMPAPIVDNRWEDITATIEATRQSLSQLVTQQIDRIEARLVSLNHPEDAVKPALPHDAQEQMEQQTQILTELVATLSVLDAHMQQIKTDMHAKG
ncbi:MAG: hypothetical protein WAO98_03310 [Alphaproteobacteria bacterium]